ncbi:MAG TPA: MerR family transcriptional regulator [Rhizomicrobium sp.]|nr:MerR family transcriptional regulator [Rhizomicrobium sp.]
MSAALAEKSPEAFRTISEVATELDVPQHVLRFWETRFAQIRPVKRAGGRRYYRPEDVDLLRGIRALLYSDGYTIKGVQKILREQGVRHVAEVGRQPPRARARRSGAAAKGADAADLAMARTSARADESTAQNDLPLAATTTPLSDHARRRQLKDLLQELHRMKKQLRAARERVRS